VAGIYRPRHSERTVLCRVLFHYFDQFLTEYENLFEKEYGYFRPIIKEVVERYLDCGNPRCGFACSGFPDCRGKPEEVKRMDYLEFIARVTSHIPDKGQVTVRYYGLYANAHRVKIRKVEEGQHKLLIIEVECPQSPAEAGPR